MKTKVIANVYCIKKSLINILNFSDSELMSLYRQLSREIERLREWKRSQAETHELYVHTAAQLNLRRKQLVKQLLLIYPIEKVIIGIKAIQKI